MRRTNVSRQKAMASTRRKSRAIAGRPSIGTPNPRPKPRTGGGMKLPTKRKEVIGAVADKCVNG